MSTLRYASRAKFIQNKPKINEDPKDAQLREMSEEIKRLKMMLEGKMPVNLGQVSENSGGVQERIIYQTVGDNKENNEALEEELRTKEEMLRNEQ